MPKGKGYHTMPDGSRMKGASHKKKKAKAGKKKKAIKTVLSTARSY